MHAYWPDYHCATLDQLDAMMNVIEARYCFKLVMSTVASIDKVEWRASGLRAPFQDTSAVTTVCTLHCH